MKKVALSLLAFALVGAMAFGQDAPVAKISGYVNTGIEVNSNSSGTYLTQLGNDYGGVDAAARATIALTGANFGYQLTPMYKNGAAAFDNGYAWVTPMDGLTIAGGFNANNGPFGDFDDNGAGAFSTSGVAAWYTMSGFSVGVLSKPANNGAAPAASTAIPTDFAVHYALDNVVGLNAFGTNNATNKLDKVVISGAFKGVPALTLTAGYQGTNMSTTTTDFADATVGYKLTDALYAGVVVYDRNISSGTNFINYKPNVSYTVSPQVSVSAYLIGDTSASPNYEPQVLVAFTPVAGATIKASVWMDTNSTSIGYNNANVGVQTAAKSSSTVTSADIDLILSF